MDTLAQTLDGLQLGDRLSQFGFRRSVVHFGLPIGESLLGALLGFQGFGFVEVGCTSSMPPETYTSSKSF